MSKLKQELNKEAVLAALRQVKDESGVDIVEAGLVSSIVIRGDNVGFAISVDIDQAAEKETLRIECEKAVKSIAGVGKVTAVLTSDKPGMLAPEKKYPEQTKSVDKSNVRNINGVKNIIIVASGKGGVGKSTVAVNLASALAAKGYKTGIADLDIYGPSVPKMLGLSGKPDIDEKNRMVPKEKNGIKSVSIGYIVDEESAVIWRSSMALKAMDQMLLGTSWGEIDFLIIDTPPGTGDIQLSLSKNYNIKGAVIVSTPQEVALLDVKKAINMFRKVHVPVIGIIENMSYFEDPVSGNRSYIFGESGAKKLAEKENLAFLGEIPIRQDIREAADNGKVLPDLKAMDIIIDNFKKGMEKLNGQQ